MKKVIYCGGFLIAALLGGCTQNVQAPVTTPHVVQAPPQYITYVVKKGDTLSGIAGQYQTSYIDLAKLNHIPAPYYIHSGEILQVPNPQVVVAQLNAQAHAYGGQIAPVKVQNSIPAQSLNLSQYAGPNPPPAPPVVSTGNGETTGKVYVAPQAVQGSPTTSGNANARSIASQLVTQQNTNATGAVAAPSYNAASPVSNSNSSSVSIQNVSTGPEKTASQITWSWPVSGQLVQGFGAGHGQMAKGVQIATAQNATILAATNGTVIYSGVGTDDYGKMIIIKSDNNFLTAYTNLASLTVKQGQAVQRGDAIGVVGQINGKSMLHFEVRKFGNPVDPLSYMPS